MKKFFTLSMLSLVLAVHEVDAANLEVDKSRSRIQVDAKATGHHFTGNLKSYEVDVEGDAVSLDPKSFELKWKFKDLDTNDAKRDTEMLKWLGSSDEKGSFKLDKSWTDEKGVERGTGTLTIHGVSKSVSFPYTAKKDGEWVTIDGKVLMDYRNFDLPIIRAMAVMTVDPQLVVRFHVVGKIN
jgi:polyisoprenoid-binding protein YceI